MKNRTVKAKLDKVGQQGDVTMRVLDALPKNAKPIAQKPVALGEVTGHAHEIEGDYELFEVGDRLIARIMNGDATILHEEHEAWTLPEGAIVEFGPTYEYDYDREESRRLAD